MQFKSTKVLQLQQKEPLCKQLHQVFKKLVSVLATSVPVTEASQEDVIALNWVSCICYPIWFKKNKVQALINSGSEVNTITPGYASKLGLKVRPTDIGVKKIDGSIFKTFGMVLASFQVEDKLGRPWFF